jgi:hypothetical protein
VHRFSGKPFPIVNEGEALKMLRGLKGESPIIFCAYFDAASVVRFKTSSGLNEPDDTSRSTGLTSAPSTISTEIFPLLRNLCD